MMFRKKPDQTYEDLVQAIQVLSMEACIDMEERDRESMTAKVFVAAVVDL